MRSLLKISKPIRNKKDSLKMESFLLLSSFWTHRHSHAAMEQIGFGQDSGKGILPVPSESYNCD